MLLKRGAVRSKGLPCSAVDSPLRVARSPCPPFAADGAGLAQGRETGRPGYSTLFSRWVRSVTGSQAPWGGTQ